jgi:hypothetical protein
MRFDFYVDLHFKVSAILLSKLFKVVIKEAIHIIYTIQKTIHIMKYCKSNINDCNLSTCDATLFSPVFKVDFICFTQHRNNTI